MSRRIRIPIAIVLVAGLAGCKGVRPSDADNSAGTSVFEVYDQPAPEASPPGMKWIPGGKFTMGADADDPLALAHERPAHPVSVDGFWMDTTEVTNAAFAAFVTATGYVTLAERKPDWKELSAQLPEGTPKPHDSLLVAGSMVFHPVETDDLSNWYQWWEWVPGADWRHPRGPGSNLDGLGDHPVVHVAWEDARAYLEWAGKRFPTEAEWEFAAMGGVRDAGPDRYCRSTDRPCANIWQGDFPSYNSRGDGYAGTAPVGSYAPNGFGMYDMAGNVWEWTADWYHAGYYQTCLSQGLVNNPAGAETAFDPAQPGMPLKVLKGGSFLCNDSYCSSYRSSARMSSTIDSGMDHAGFRGVRSP